MCAANRDLPLQQLEGVCKQSLLEDNESLRNLKECAAYASHIKFERAVVVACAVSSTAGSV